MEKMGPRQVSDEVLLAVLLRSGIKGMSVVALARKLLQEYGSLPALAHCSQEELAARRGMGKVKAQVLVAAIELARRINDRCSLPSTPINKPSDAADVLREEVMLLDRENFWVLVLDARNRLKSKPVRVSAGLLDASLVHPREVFQEAIRRGAGAVILAHNHPSGDPAPSPDDVRVTRQLVEAGKIVDIRVLDHVILGKPLPEGKVAFFSMKEKGEMNFS